MMTVDQTTMKLNTFSKVPKSIHENTSVRNLEDTIASLKLRNPDECINIAVTGDIHLAHRRVKTERITSTLDREISNELLEHLDVLVLNGDIFDRRIYMDSDPVYYIRSWIRKLLRRCFKYNVRLVVLKGTPSHDGDQCATFVALATTLQQADIQVDLRYHDELVLEKLLDNDKSNRLHPNGLYTLYVPDELNHDSSVTWMQVNEKLRLAGITKVDFCFMHGLFTYQEIIRTPVSHLEENYVPLTNHLIAINHWHMPSAKDNIIAPGSIERLTHGQEESKGFLVASLGKDNVLEKYFVVNPTATIFKQIDCSGMLASEVIQILSDDTSFEDGSCVELRSKSSEDAYLSFAAIARKFPKFTLTFKELDSGVMNSLTDKIMLTDQVVSISPSTIYSIMEERLKHDNLDVLNRALEIVKE